MNAKASKFIILYPRFPIREKGPKFNVPLAPLHLGTYLVAQGIETKFIDCIVEDNYLKRLKSELQNSFAVGISVMTAQLPHALKLCEVVRRTRPDIPIIMGGVHPTLFPEQTVCDKRVDYAVIGEGELPLLNLLRSIRSEEKRHLDSIKGIAFRDDEGRVRVTPKQKRFNFTELPPINYNLLGKEVRNKFGTYAVSMQTSRGCPYRCRFCINTIVKENRVWRAWEPERVAKEIEALLRLDCKFIWFWDENFFIQRSRIYKIITLVEERNLEFEWFANVRADYFRDDYLNREFLTRLCRAGCRRISIGAESGSQKILDYLRKDIQVEDLYKSAQLCREANIQPTYSFMIGLPRETKEDIKKTVEAMRRISAIGPRFRFLGPQLFRPYPGSTLYQECLASGWQEPRSLEEWSEIISTKFIESDPFRLPWVKEPNFVNTIWFYAFLLAAGCKKFLSLYREYCQILKKSKIILGLGYIAIVLLALIGNLRYRLNFHRAQIEIKALKRYRAFLSA